MIRFPADLALVRDLLAAQPQAWDRVVTRVADTVWAACRVLEPDEEAARAAFTRVMDGLRADGHRRLRAYDGSSRLSSFVALTAREILADRLLGLLETRALATDRGWLAFERLFAADIERILARRLPGPEREEARRDARQDICLALLGDDFRRLRAWRGTGSFSGFVLQTVDRLLIDSLRRSGQCRRAAAGTIPIAEPLPEEDGLPCPAPTPEEALLGGEAERLLRLAGDGLRQATAALGESERLYVEVALAGGEMLPAREVARRMNRPVAEVYKLKQRAMARLREALVKNPAVKMWRASV